jgi:hypothetical protein
VNAEGGYTAVVLPDLLYVEFNRSRQGMAALGNPGKLLHEALIRNSNPSATSGEIFGSVPESAKLFSAVEAHERDHVRRLLSTSFGLLCHALRSQQLVAARELVTEAALRPGGLTLPFELVTDQSNTSLRALTAARLQRAFEDRLRIDHFRDAERALAGWTVNGCEYVAADLPDTHSTLRTTNAGGAPPAEWLTSCHLLELFGACEEGNRLLGTGAGIEQIATRLQSKDRRYSLPLLIWLTLLPTSKDGPKPFIRPPRPGELTLSFYRTFPLELFVAADLALWPPFAPEGLISSNTELDWTDLSPAFRFKRILMAYNKLGVNPSVWPDDDINVFIPTLQRRVCEMYGWPTPGELAARWYHHLAAKEHTWFPDSVLGGFRYTTTLQLLALRRDRPGDVVVNNVDYHAEQVGRTAGWITRESELLLVPKSLAADADRQATEFWFHLHALAPALLNTKWDRLGHLRRYPPHVRLDCIDSFDAWGSAIPDWPSDEFRRRAAELLRVG